jgi:hypothetical protein
LGVDAPMVLLYLDRQMLCLLAELRQDIPIRSCDTPGWHGWLEGDERRYADRLTGRGVDVALLFPFFHKRL